MYMQCSYRKTKEGKSKAMVALLNCSCGRSLGLIPPSLPSSSLLLPLSLLLLLSSLLLLRRCRHCYCVVIAVAVAVVAAVAVIVASAIVVAAVVLAVAIQWDGSPRHTAANPSVGFVSLFLGWPPVMSSFDTLALGTRVVSGIGWNEGSGKRPRQTSWFVFETHSMGLPLRGSPLMFFSPQIHHRMTINRPHPFGKGRGGCGATSLLR